MAQAQAEADRFDAIVIGAGAAGLMAAATAAQRGRRVLLVDHARNPGEKIRISGGGRCNFTNLGVEPARFLSGNPKFCISALKRYTQWDFIDLVTRHGIAWHEKTLGQLFCDGSARQIVSMLVGEAQAAGVRLILGRSVSDITQSDGTYRVTLDGGTVSAPKLVVACGGKSIPKMGASSFGYEVAARFGVPVTETRPALVPLTFAHQELDHLKPLAGLSCPARVGCNGTTFDEALLFTHRGLSGPSILQISSYWREGDSLRVQLAPETDIADALRLARSRRGGQMPATVLSRILPERLAQHVCQRWGGTGRIGDQSETQITALADAAANWVVTPVGSEGYRTAEVTLGGVDTDALDSRTMEVRTVPGLHFIGEVVDVTGWLGGYNFQWAWSSGWAVGQAL
ncbi:BaiN/RdsA family NAD(P)/FAD-dependent oxidoreductase [Oceanomicrobium pacificus]|uniref:Aminoacetone oxidase family FAD-binding enzyme n=1 Tax=Oceanomicrobium pacificus TaxID=2692916 RepID=A0A6B0TJP1_9RHOB|nr:NAD(P)/FAD-dependent oxidoreductase [Oceanomicrobium pacificus]MXU64657.1 aminoacetone oxidase family FAD-binding enzyme [Oceanomicrobium pacificus]